MLANDDPGMEGYRKHAKFVDALANPDAKASARGFVKFELASDSADQQMLARDTALMQHHRDLEGWKTDEVRDSCLRDYISMAVTPISAKRR